MLIKRITRRVDVPHEPGEWLELRYLDRSQFKEAAIIRQREAAGMAKSYGGELFSAIQKTREELAVPPDAKPAEPTIEELVAAYDPDTLLKLAVAGWSYDEEVSEDALKRLDEATVEWAVKEIVAAFHQTKERREAETFLIP